MIDKKKRSAAIMEIEAMVNEFNLKFKYWKDQYGLDANLAWAYKNGKALEVKEITMSVFKKEPVIPDLNNYKPQ